MIKFRKRLTKFKITIALPKKFGSKGFITVIKVNPIWLKKRKQLAIEYDALQNGIHGRYGDVRIFNTQGRAWLLGLIKARVKIGVQEAKEYGLPTVSVNK